MKVLASLCALFLLVASVQSIACPAMGAAQLYAVLAYSTVTSTGASSVAGSVGLYPGSAIVGFPPATLTGALQTGASVAQLAATTLYNNLAGLACTNVTTELGGQTLTPGVYCVRGAATIGSAMTLNGAGVYVFIIDTTFVGTAQSAVTLTNGATACNIFYAVGTSATFNSGDIKGNVVAMQAISLTTAAKVSGGRLFALNAAVTMDTNAITTCFCDGVAEPVGANSQVGLTTLNAPKNSAPAVVLSAAGIFFTSMLISLFAL